MVLSKGTYFEIKRAQIPGTQMWKYLIAIALLLVVLLVIYIHCTVVSIVNSTEDKEVHPAVYEFLDVLGKDLRSSMSWMEYLKYYFVIDLKAQHAIGNHIYYVKADLSMHTRLTGTAQTWPNGAESQSISGWLLHDGTKLVSVIDVPSDWTLTEANVQLLYQHASNISVGNQEVMKVVQLIRDEMLARYPPPVDTPPPE